MFNTRKKFGVSLLILGGLFLSAATFPTDEVDSNGNNQPTEEVLTVELKHQPVIPAEKPLLQQKEEVVAQAVSLKEEKQAKQEAEWRAAKEKAAAEKAKQERIEQERLARIEAENQARAKALIEEEKALAKEKEKKETPKNNPVEKPIQEESVPEEEAPVVTEQVIAEEPAPEPVHALEENVKTLTVEATAYSTNQPSLGNLTYTGIDLRQTPNVIAVDPSFIPLGSTIEIPGYGTFIAGDTGSAIIGNRIDIHMTNLDAAVQFGRKTMTIKIID